jgi:hypothetical protein
MVLDHELVRRAARALRVCDGGWQHRGAEHGGARRQQRAAIRGEGHGVLLVHAYDCPSVARMERKRNPGMAAHRAGERTSPSRLIQSD